MSKGKLHQIHPVLPVKNVLAALFFYTNKLGFEIAFADDPKAPTYVGVRRDEIEIHLQWHDEKEWDSLSDRPMLRIVTEHIESLYDEYVSKEIFPKDTILKETPWNTKEFAFYDMYMNGLVFYSN
ncbi:hypothetical protein SAMN03097699_0021 [Flavobacteriaceae bacterium MAR_2010_188]|nr:hypothetical protein SAMN03097699_0021 [Flavobacteriaceae bacterium MAR_2010_188]